MASFSEYKEGYERNWADLKIRSSVAASAKKQAKRLLDGKEKYKQIEERTGVPWWFVGLCHYRESAFNFETYLGNGQSLSRRTTIVPKGRGPFTGPDAFVDGAVDALRLEGFVGASDWGIARVLYRLEGFNGYGYHGHGVNSPYLYGGSTSYGPPEARAGKYVRDGVFDSSFVDTQLGTAVILKSLLGLEPTIVFGSEPGAETSTQPDDELAKDVLWVQRSLNALGANPQLVEDGKSGPKTRASISRFQQMNGLEDTGLADAGTVAAIDRQVHSFGVVAGNQVKEKLDTIEAIIRSMAGGTIADQGLANVAGGQPRSELADILGALGGAVQRIQTAIPASDSATPEDRLRKALGLLTTALVPGTKVEAPLGQVNGALGQTVGQLLDGKKSAIGIIGAVLTQLLAHVPAGTGLGQVLTLLTPAAGLSPYTMPIFLGLAAWGVLGKLEKWAQGKALPASR
ncbi:peptidoglycan-binding protein [Mesorhizobium sp. VK4C]|uniref:peptidoglycan-binding protein n=1 Tax=Mesorhizobium captivum TaxID=3072319 RepID=UPI002A24C1B3|nr:peptidoglycan-binding protein [Mesorhizobium sp. VK4C]MDX8501918.1 peptidoglycan-binding protein [Mesorhizobium sp. VK4C]